MLAEGEIPTISEKSHFQLTRELELLISGALVFALLGVPGIIDNWWGHVLSHVSGAPYGVAFGVYYVAKLAGYALISTILMHFLLRGFWVALLGLRGVFPNGIDESRLNHGPFLESFYSGRLGSLQRLEDRVDRLAASVFAFVFMFLLLLVAGVLWTSTGGLLGLALSQLTGRPGLLGTTFWVTFLIFLTLQLSMVLIDRLSKKRALSPGTLRATTAVMKFVHYSTLNFIYAPIFFTFTTRVSRRLMSVIQIAFMYTLVTMFAVSVFFSLGLLGFDSYIFFPPQAGSDQLRTAYYESTRGDEQSVTPTIQSDIITDPYVRLFIPYNTRRDNAKLRGLCPTLRPFRSDGLFARPRGRSEPEHNREALACLAKLVTVELDGRPLPELEYAFYVHPRSRVHGRLAMIPAAPLAPGRHVIVIRRLPVRGVDEGRSTTEFYIPFWK